MIRTMHKTIQDYWHPHVSRTRPAVYKGEAQNTFGQAMRSAYQSGMQVARPKTRGLTIQDYWRRPLTVSPHATVKPAREAPPESLPLVSPAPARRSGNAPAAPDGSGASAPLTRRQQIEQIARATARKYGLPAGLVQSVIRHESNFNPRAVSRAGARGLMQLMPATARELGVDDSFDIQQNIEGGSRYLRQMLDRFDGDVRKALAAYNAGPGTVQRFGDVPPYPETRRYIDKVLTSFAETV